MAVSVAYVWLSGHRDLRPLLSWPLAVFALTPNWMSLRAMVRLRFPMLQLDRAQPSSDVRVSFLQRLDRLRQVERQDPKEAYPTDQIHIDRLNAQHKAVAPSPRCQLADTPVESLLRALRQQHLHLSAQRLAPQTKAEEVTLFGPRYSALGGVHHKAHAPLDELHHARHHALSCTLTADVDVAVRHHDARTQHSPDQAPEGLVFHALTQPRKKSLVMDAIEEPLQIQVDHPLIALLEHAPCAVGPRRSPIRCHLSKRSSQMAANLSHHRRRSTLLFALRLRRRERHSRGYAPGRAAASPWGSRPRAVGGGRGNNPPSK